MKKKKLLMCMVAFVISITLGVYAFSPAASAIVSKNGSISLHIADSESGDPLPGTVFRLYFFAAAYEKGDGVGYEYVIPYENCDMNMGDLQDAYLPVHLAHFALTNGLPYVEKISDENGYIVFDNLQPGVYLILATEIVENYFLPSPFVINIPVYNDAEKNWEYDINATPKMQFIGFDNMTQVTYLSVKKLWDTDEKTPESITVTLLRDLQEVEKVELSAENNWYYRWDGLGMQHVWNVVEAEVPDGYVVSYDFSSNTVIITNTKKSPVDETTQPDVTAPSDESTTAPTESTEPSLPDESTTKPTEERPTSPDESTTRPDELIHTGQLNWPVPVFSIAGLLIFSIGWAMLNLGKKDEEAV